MKTLLTLRHLLGACIVTQPSQGALVASLEVLDSHRIKIIVSGNLSGPPPPNFIDEITLDIEGNIIGTGQYPVDEIGSFGSTYINGGFFTNANTDGDAIALLINNVNYQHNDLVSGEVTLRYSSPHTVIIGSPFEVFWGTPDGPESGTFQYQGLVTGIPEPSSSLLIALGAFLPLLRYRSQVAR